MNYKVLKLLFIHTLLCLSSYFKEVDTPPPQKKKKKIGCGSSHSVDMLLIEEKELAVY